jgi:hypothetical protein
LAWLEDSLHGQWQWVRPEDLATFAFNAMRPAWPRSTVAISHRSSDTKPLLQRLDLWRSPTAAIDASYVPSWDTNLGMIWGLFAASPLIVRVDSPRYSDSTWCRREWEMAEHLVNRSDFLVGRRILDVKLENLDIVDDLVLRAERIEASLDRTKPKGALVMPRLSPFPPKHEVLMARPLDDVEVLVLRAAGAIRLLNVVYGTDEVNAIIDNLLRGQVPGVPVVTNNVDEWTPYVDMFKGLAQTMGPSFSTPLRLAGPIDDESRARDRALVLKLPDLKTGFPDVRDVCAGIEWYRTFLRWFIEEDFGDHVVIDIRGAALETWGTALGYSHLRGLASLNTESPMWILQKAGQNADHWPGLGEWPLFTEHVTSQFDWMMEVFLLSSWPLLYQGLAGLEISQDLLGRLFQLVDPGDIPTGNSIGPRDVFGMKY